MLGSINDEKDVEFFQKDLENYYSWATHNNMAFNDTKFVFLRYGRNNTLKENTTYFTDGMNCIIEEMDSHKDLSVQMSSDGSFSHHIDKLVKKVRKKVGWICRSFMSRDLVFLRKILISQVRPLIDYCTQV